MLCTVVHIIYCHVFLFFLAHCPHPSPPFPKSCHGNYTCIFLNCTGYTSLFCGNINSRKHTTPYIYNDCILKEIDSFKYLGMAFNRQGNLNYAQTVLVQQAIRARAILETYLRNHKHMPVNIVFELFDTLIKPILLYACEIWGNKMGRYKKMHINFIKTALDVKTSKNTCLLQLC